MMVWAISRSITSSPELNLDFACAATAAEYAPVRPPESSARFNRVRAEDMAASASFPTPTHSQTTTVLPAPTAILLTDKSPQARFLSVALSSAVLAGAAWLRVHP